MPANIKIELTNEENSIMRDLLVRAQRQMDFVGKVLPEEKSVMDKYPGTNPVGYYSEIDMGFAERMKRCDAAVSFRNPLMHMEYHELKGKIASNPAFLNMQKEMKDTSKKLRLVNRALKLCDNDNVRKVLEERKERLQNHPSLKEYSTAIEALEVYSGAKLYLNDKDELADQGRITQFCKEKLGISVGSDLVFNPFSQATNFINPKKLEIEFENLDDIMMSQRMVRENNRGKNWKEVEEATVEAASFDEYAAGIPSYMQASCDRVLDVALPTVKDRADLIHINGVSVRQQMKEAEGIENPTDEEIKKYSSLYVAAALRNGIYVETFVRDMKGGDKVNYKPVPITTKGNDSYLLKKDGDSELQNITIGFFDRFLAKLGFSYYQKKLEKADAVERIKQSRTEFRKAHKSEMKKPMDKEAVEERKKAYKELYKQKDRFLDFREKNRDYSVNVEMLSNQFFPKGPVDAKNKATGLVVAGDREKMRVMAVVKMLREGYTLEEVLDTGKNADVRAKMADMVVEELENCDAKRFFEMHLEALETLGNALEDYAQKNQISYQNPDKMFGKDMVLLDLATGAGNITDVILQESNRKQLEDFFGKGIMEKTNQKTDGYVINGMVPAERAKISEIYTRMADGVLPSSYELGKVVRFEVVTGVLAKLEENTGKVFNQPVGMAEMGTIQNMVLAHPKVQKFFETSTPEKLVDVLTKGNVLKELKIDFEFLPEKKVLGRNLESELFSIDVDCETTPKLNIVPTVDGKSSFYEMQDPEMENDMGMGM